MKALAINGSPRKNGNTATLLNKALEGAATKGAETDLLHLRDLDLFSGKEGHGLRLHHGNIKRHSKWGRDYARSASYFNEEAGGIR